MIPMISADVEMKARARSRSPRRNLEDLQYANDMGYEAPAWAYDPSRVSGDEDFDRGFARGFGRENYAVKGEHYAQIFTVRAELQLSAKQTNLAIDLKATGEQGTPTPNSPDSAPSDAPGGNDLPDDDFAAEEFPDDIDVVIRSRDLSTRFGQLSF